MTTTTKIVNLRLQLKLHDAKEPLKQDFHTVYGYERAWVKWSKASSKLFCEIIELESNV